MTIEAKDILRCDSTESHRSPSKNARFCSRSTFLAPFTPAKHSATSNTNATVFSAWSNGWTCSCPNQKYAASGSYTTSES